MTSESTISSSRLKMVMKMFDVITFHLNGVDPTALPQLSVHTDPSTMDEEEIEKSTPYQKCLMIPLMKHTSLGIGDTRVSVVKKSKRSRDSEPVHGTQVYHRGLCIFLSRKRRVTLRRGRTLRVRVQSIEM